MKIISREFTMIIFIIIFVFKGIFLRKPTFQFAEHRSSASRHVGKTGETIRLMYTVEKAKELRAATRFVC
jgi:hypothetical protein